ncbi:chemotaxis-specific protein-glutamate methyltransferase CheB [Bradyrhizobium sp. RD5-C2]|uniref:chemotaxis-specific protein-glutamate methyltransferase CheB n=1 Tax=Bradyrhizobium sp. RD5-C2 TaxID=244562 RepID=UPI001CC61949|nr:chemotaxis-specific protein-glutamate methyltransferase CheB [Bradyrhizobium sp. RD5-C2]GIQ75098.1 chemotaxis response regulator protein-glutamate methylesterase 3 [Bradyrhizobium sp. RD5-C2]
MIKVLVVDDSALVRKLIGQAFSREADFEVGFARNGREALAAITDFRPDVVTLDVHMPEMDGLSCLDRIMIETPCPVVMVSSMTAAGADATLEALRLGAVDFVAKPTGAVSLRFDDVGRMLIEKVRAAAGARLKSSLRLRDRVRFRIGEGARAPASSPGRRAKSVRKGEGLVLVGTSTGGPPALEALLSGLPPSFPWPILVAQHMPATFTGPLARRLDGMSALRVQEVRDPIAVQPGHVYIGRGDADVIVSRRGSALLAMAAPAQADYPWHPSTDRLVRTALNHMAASQLIGILMTGMGNDGAEAMALIHAGGGKTIAEAEETAVVWGMPGELVKAKGADFIMPLNKIAAQLKKLVS